MIKQPAYALLSVLIVMGLVTTIDLIRYRQYSQQRQIYTRLQNELVCQTMVSLADKSKPSDIFNTGTVKIDTSGLSKVELKNGFVYQISQTEEGS